MDLRQQLVVANRILAAEGILEAFGHVRVRDAARHDRFLLAWARAPELVEDADLLEFELEGSLVQQTDCVPYLERFIHAAMYAQRPDVMAVCHNHTPSILPFSISRTTRLQPVIHSAAVLGGAAPVWDIADEFGNATNMLVVNMDQGHSLVRKLGQGTIALMRGHGAVVAGPSVPAVVSACVNMDKNARVQLQALQLGEYVPLARGEIKREVPRVTDRAWEAFVRRVGFDSAS